MTEDYENSDNRDGNAFDEEKQLELSLRPTKLGEYIGQKKVKDNLRVFMKAALKRREALDHILLFRSARRWKNYAFKYRRQRNGRGT
jgi:Holliday junction resolvasome RuvABC ATP-dependent DNA helicase subunit